MIDPRLGMAQRHGKLLGSAWAEACRLVEQAGASQTDRFAEYRGREEAFVEEVLGVRMWAAGRAMFRSAFKNQLTVVRSSRKGSKTHTMGVLLVTYMNVWESVVISLAPTNRQIETQLWGEVRDLYANAKQPLLGTPGQKQLKLGPKHYALGFSTDKQDRVQGFHAGATPPEDPDRDLTPEELEELVKQATDGLYTDDEASLRRIVFLCDEGAGIAQILYSAMQGSLQGPKSRLVIGGNPTLAPDEDHEFALACQPGSGYHRIKIAAIDAEDPIDADETFTHIPNWLCDQEWIDGQIKKYGKDSAHVRVYVCGMFAGIDIENRVISLDLLQAAEVQDVNADIGRHMGVDIADSGGDECVASLWDKGVQIAIHAWTYVDTPEGLMKTVHTIRALRARWGADGKPLPAANIHMDNIGIGKGPYARLHEMGIPVEGVDFGASPDGDWFDLTEETLFINRRAELHWIFRRAHQEGIGKTPRKLHGELNPTWNQAQWPQYKEVERSKGTHIQILAKALIRKAHGGKSPDYLDAALLAWSRGGVGPTFGTMA